MKKTTLVVMAWMLSLTGCQTCSNLTQSVTAQTKSCFSRLGNLGGGRCSSGNCRMRSANNVGAPCDAGCDGGQAMTPAAGECSTCGETAGFGSYDGGTVGGFDGMVTGSYDGIPSSSIPMGSTTIPMGSSSAVPSGSYLSSPTPAVVRETIVPKPAN